MFCKQIIGKTLIFISTSLTKLIDIEVSFSRNIVLVYDTSLPYLSNTFD